MNSLLTPEHIEEFERDGVVVIENVLTNSEVQNARQNFHAQLSEMNIDHDGILRGDVECDVGHRIKGPASRIFYARWKMDVHFHPKVVASMKDLMIQTYGQNIDGYSHPFGEFSDILGYVDRVCWRLPDSIREEGGLGLHLDRNPTNPYLLNSGGRSNLKKWRPIQAFVTLTDHYITNSGGLRVVKGFHREIDEYFGSEEENNEEDGEFFRMGSKKYTSLQQRLEPIFVSKGSLVCWDNRLPHATAAKLDGTDTREVVYAGFLPDVMVNRTYVMSQLEAFVYNRPPPAYIESDPNEQVDRDWDIDDLTREQKQMLLIYTT
jgi:Gig2-like